MRYATLLLAATLTATSGAAQSRLEELPGWKVASDTELFGETFVAEFMKIASKFLDQGYFQRLPEDRQPTLEVVRKKHGDTKTISEFEVITGVSNTTFQPIREKIRFYVYGRFALGVSPKDPARIQWVRLLEPPAK